MIQIKSTKLRKLDDLCEEHFQKLEPYITSNIASLKKRQIDFITTNLKQILTCKPKDLYGINKRYIRYCTEKSGKYPLLKKNVGKGLSKVFNYKWFTATNAVHYCGYDLAKKLNFKTCPYCNRNYTVTVAEGKDRIVRPDFDHFYPKGQYPLLALSFYNLIPSCLICNRTIKNQAKIVHGKFIHPYEEGFGTALKINFFPKDADSALGLKDNYTVIKLLNILGPVKAQKCSNSFELFKLKEIYEESHNGEIADIIKKHYITNGKYLEILHKAFPKLGSIEELYNIAFGNYLHDDNLEKRPLSKMTRDIVEQLVFNYPVLNSLVI